MRRHLEIHPTPAPAMAPRPAAPARVPLLLIIGPPGVGKSSVARYVSALLSDAQIDHACVDRDDFSVGGLLHEDPLLDLNEMLHARVSTGAQRLVVAWRVESGLQLTRFRAALGWADITVCRLRAEPGALLERIAAGQSSFQRLHLQTMALEIAPRLDRQAAADIILTTDDAPARSVAMRAFRRWAMHGAAMVAEPPG